MNSRNPIERLCLLDERQQRHNIRRGYLTVAVHVGRWCIRVFKEFAVELIAGRRPAEMVDIVDLRVSRR